MDDSAKAEVTALYHTAGLSVDKDLNALQAAPRVAPATPQAIAKMDSYTTAGSPRLPILTMHTTGDNVVASVETACADRVRANHDTAQLRQTYVSAPGHCNFTTSEQLNAIKTMDQRLSTGAWPNTSPEAMNKGAAGTGASHSVHFQPETLPRPQLHP